MLRRGDCRRPLSRRIEFSWSGSFISRYEFKTVQFTGLPKLVPVLSWYQVVLRCIDSLPFHFDLWLKFYSRFLTYWKKSVQSEKKLITIPFESTMCGNLFAYWIKKKLRTPLMFLNQIQRGPSLRRASAYSSRDHYNVPAWIHVV